MTNFGRGNIKGRRLTPMQVYEIKERYSNGGVSQASLAREFGVCRETVARVVRGETWAQFKTPQEEKSEFDRAAERALKLSQSLEQMERPQVLDKFMDDINRTRDLTDELEELKLKGEGR